MNAGHMSSATSPNKHAEIQIDNYEISTIKEFAGAGKKEVKKKRIEGGMEKNSLANRLRSRRNG